MEKINLQDPQRIMASLQQVASEQAAQLAQARVNYTTLERAYMEAVAANDQLTAELEKATKTGNRSARRADAATTRKKKTPAKA